MFRPAAVAAAAFAALTACSTPAASTKAAAPASPAAQPAAAAAPVAFDGMPAVGTQARCPVSGEVFTVTADTVKAEYHGKTYVFCCPHCKPSFEAEPEKYTAAK